MGRLWNELEPVAAQQADRLSVTFAADERADKLDLSGDMCMTTEDATDMADLMTEVAQLIAVQPSQTAPVGGDPACHGAIMRLVLGPEPDIEHLAAVTVAGPTAAARLALDLIQRANPETTVWLPTPGSDPDYMPLAALAMMLGLNMRPYRYVGPDGDSVCIDDMLTDLNPCAPGDVVVIPGCCHNPTGLDLSDAQWGAIAGLFLETGAVPLVQIVAQGLGRGLDKDVDGVQGLLLAIPEALITVDCTQSFGLLGDHPCFLLVQGETPTETERAQDQLDQQIRDTTGSLPNHGARMISRILHSANLRSAWDRALRKTRQNLAQTRASFAATLREATDTDRWEPIAIGHGPYAKLPLSEAQLNNLWQHFAIFARPDGRINLTALSGGAAQRVAQAVADCLADRIPEAAPEQADTVPAEASGTDADADSGADAPDLAQTA